MGSTSHVADYIVMPKTETADPDKGFKLRVDERMSFRFKLPPGLVRGERAILAFVADPSSDADNVKYEVEINDHRLKSAKFSSGVVRTIIEVVGGGILRDGDANSIEFSVISGTTDTIWAGPKPSITFSDVVLWFQRKVAESPDEA